MSPMTLTAALRHDHVRSAADYGSTSRRAGPCCINLEPRTLDAVRMRRAQRRRERQAFRSSRQEY